MGSTNSTPNYELSQFIGTDKPAWLQDYNGDMLKIDTGIAGAKTAADNAQSAADGAQGDATSALSGIADINTELGTVENTLGTAVGNINTINSLIGNGTPTTTDQTIIGAINEINAKTNKALVGWKIINEDAVQATVTADGVKTVAELYNELAIAARDAALSLPDENYFIEIIEYAEDGYGTSPLRRNELLFKTSTGEVAFEFVQPYCTIDATYAKIMNIQGYVSTIAGQCEKREVGINELIADGTLSGYHTDYSATVLPSGTKLYLIGNLWNKAN